MKKILLLFAIFVSIIFSMDDAKAQDEYSSDQELSKQIDNIYLRMALEDVAYMDIVRLAGPPKAVQERIPDSEFLDTLRNRNSIHTSLSPIRSKRVKNIRF